MGFATTSGDQLHTLFFVAYVFLKYCHDYSIVLIHGGIKMPQGFAATNGDLQL
jgi:hypothetical protein